VRRASLGEDFFHCSKTGARWDAPTGKKRFFAFLQTVRRRKFNGALFLKIKLKKVGATIGRPPSNG